MDSVLQKYSNLIVEEVQNIPLPKQIIQYAEPNYTEGMKSLYFNQSHIKLQKAVREFMDKEIMPFVNEWEEKREVPVEVRKKCAEVGLLKTAIGKWPEKYGKECIGGISLDKFDIFHGLIISDEINRTGSFGVVGNILGSLSIGLPPVFKFGSKFLQDKVGDSCMSGEKQICLAITEPHAGSDVAAIKTFAKKTEDGKHFIVNGEKKFITNGIWGDYYTTAVRTEKGISLLLIERDMPGVKARRMNMQGGWASGTGYITFDNVKVPVENLIGKEGNGFQYIMFNFNMERLGIIYQALRFSRICYEDAFAHAYRRSTFGKKLIENDVIRAKLGDMARRIEGVQAWTELISYQVQVMAPMEANIKLAGVLSLLKVESTQVLEFCSREAIQIFGGLGYTRGGLAGRVERIYRDVRVLAIGGGSEEIMTDFAIRQALKFSKL